MRFFYLLLVFCSPVVFSDDISGDWYQSCEDDSGYHINIPKNGHGVIEVISNQIYVNTSFHTKNNEVLVYYVSPEELGRGGMTYNWNVFSTVKPIAKIKLKKSKEITFKWSGFFNKKNNSYEIVNDFFESKNNFSHEEEMYRCN